MNREEWRGKCSVSYGDRKQASWIREQIKVEGILLTMYKKKWSWTGHITRRADNRWTEKVTEWQPRNCKRSQGGEGRKSRWRDEIVGFAGAGWNTLTTSDRERWKGLGKASTGLVMAKNDDEVYHSLTYDPFSLIFSFLHNVSPLFLVSSRNTN